MRGGGGRRSLLLVAPVLFGLLAMHALVAPQGASHGGMVPAAVTTHDRPGAPGAATTPVSDHRTGHRDRPALTTTDVMPGAAGGAHHGQAVHDVTGTELGPATAPAASGPRTGPVAERPVPSGHDVAGHLLHLCLAVLAALGAVVLAVWAFLGRVPFPAPAAAPPHGWSAPAGRPPPVPRRLATLCVLRN